MKRAILIGCVRQKLDRPAPARELYVSDWFKKALAYAEGQHPRVVCVVSAFHGIVPTDREIFPYDRTLADFTKRERDAWGGRAMNQLRALLDGPILHEWHLELLAGRVYVEALAAGMTAGEWAMTTTPLAGLGIGEQKAWLVACTGRPIVPESNYEEIGGVLVKTERGDALARRAQGEAR